MFTNEFADLLLNLCAVLFARNLLHLISVIIHVHRYKRAEVKTNLFKTDKCYSHLRCKTNPIIFNNKANDFIS